MVRKKTTISKGSLFSYLLLAAAVVLLVPHKYSGNLNWLFYRAFSQVFTFAQGTGPEIFVLPSEDDFVSRYDYNNLQKEYNNALAVIAELRTDFEKLSSIRTNIPNDNVGIVLAKVIPTSYSGSDEIRINKGTLDGLKVGQYVLIREGNCVIGTISETSDTISKVKLVTASKHNIPVIVWRLGKNTAVRGQLVGTGKDTAKISLIPKEQDIRAGDMVSADSRPGFLDAPITIGQVSEVVIDKDEPLLLDITVKPIDELTKVQSVIVLVMGAPNKYIDRQDYTEAD